MKQAPPVDIVLHQRSGELEVRWEDGTGGRIALELLRVYSPSAEVQGHGPGQAVVQTGKRHVGVSALEPVGHYAVRPTFDDGHDSGLYTWELLHALATQGARYWQRYEAQLAASGKNRDDPMGTGPVPGGSACASH